MLKTINKKILVVMLVLLMGLFALVLTGPTYALSQIVSIKQGTTLITEFDLENTVSFDVDIDGSSAYLDFAGNEANLVSGSYTLESSANLAQIVSIKQGTTLITEFDLENTVSFDVDIDGSNAYLDFNGNEANLISGRSYTLEFVVDMSPVITGETTFATNVDERRPLSYFLQWIKAFDETDGDITDQIKVETDNYTPNMAVLGNQTFTISVSDSSGNKTTAVINIYVADVTKPVIVGSPTAAQIGYKETWNIANFKTTLTVTDNYSTLTASDITVKSDGYTTNKTKLGTYNVVYSVKDSSGNEGTFNKPVTVIDNVKPLFDGPLTIATSNTTVLTESDVRARLTASDEIDGNLTSKIKLEEDNYSGKGNKVGSYTIKYSVTDNAGNKTEWLVTINRTDLLPPTLWVENGKTIRVPQGTTISREQIIDILETTGVLKMTATTTFTFPVDEYLGNEEIPGAYLMSIKARSTNGSEDVHNVTIQVLADSDNPDEPIIKPVEEPNWAKDNWAWLALAGLIVIGGTAIVIKKRK